MKLLSKLILVVLLIGLWVPTSILAQANMYTRGTGSTVSVTPTVTAASTNYTAGDCVGGVQAVTSILTSTPGSGQNLFVGVADQGITSRNLNVIIFNTNPSSSTFVDNGACTVAAADVSKIACVVEIRTHYPFATNGFSYGYTPGCIAVAGGTTFYAVAVAQEGGYLYSATNALTFNYSAVRD